MKKKSLPVSLWKFFMIFSLLFLFSQNLSAQNYSSPEAFAPSIANLDPVLQSIVLEPTFFNNVGQPALEELAEIAEDNAEVSDLPSCLNIHSRLDTWMDENMTAQQKATVVGQYQMSPN